MPKSQQRRARTSTSSRASLPAIDAALRARHEQWLTDITAIPTAAGHEQRVIAWLRDWVAQRKDLRAARDKSGNMLVTRRAPGKASRRAPLFITAHLDHPAFVVRSIIDPRTLELEFRGGVNDPYFDGAKIDVFESDPNAAPHPAGITTLDSAAKPFKRVTAQLQRPTDRLRPGDIARWSFQHEPGTLPRIEHGVLHTHACDDLAAVAAAISAFDLLRARKGCEHVGLLFTRAEEVGFLGAIAACKHRSVPKSARLICLENSRSFPHDSPIGAGPIVRVGDRMSVFEPTLTNQISALMMEHQKQRPEFKYQRKLMPGGTCEATTFSAYGYRSTCLCLPLGNYHNMTEIDEVAAGKRPARVGPEFISVGDYHGLIEMLIVCATRLDAAGAPTLRGRMESLIMEFGFVLHDT